MIAIVDASALRFNATSRGLPIYLDHDSLTDLATGDSRRRDRFIGVLHGGGDLLFSVAHGVELGDRQGKAVNAIRAFLDDVGPCWVPIELDTHEAMKRELQTGSKTACVCTRLVKDYLAFRVQHRQREELFVWDDGIFDLGAMFDWLLPQRESLRQGKRELDAALITKISRYRQQFETDPAAFDHALPAAAPFNPQYPITFTLINLIRTLVFDAKAYQLKKGDGIDFSHAVIAASFARAATVDKAWKRRIETLPKPNNLAKMYYRPELDQLVDDLEEAVKVLQARDAALAVE